MNAPDRDIRDLLQPLRAAEPSEDRSLEPLDRAIEQASDSVRRRRSRKRRFGPPAGLVLGVLVVGAAAATATGVISFGGLAGTTSRDDTSALDLSELVGVLERHTTTDVRLHLKGPVRSGLVTRAGLNIQVALTERRVCLLAPGRQVVGRDYEDLRGQPDTERTDLPSLDEIPRARDLMRSPRQYACVAVGHLDDQLPAIFGSDERRSWVVMLAPDQVDDVQATTADGRAVAMQTSQNLAVAVGPSARPFTNVAWTDSDGHRHESPTTPQPTGGNNE